MANPIPIIIEEKIDGSTVKEEILKFEKLKQECLDILDTIKRTGIIGLNMDTEEFFLWI